MLAARFELTLVRLSHEPIDYSGAMIASTRHLDRILRSVPGALKQPLRIGLGRAAYSRRRFARDASRGDLAEKRIHGHTILAAYRVG